MRTRFESDTSVDNYFREGNYGTESDWPYEDVNAMFFALHHDEFEDVYGIPGNDISAMPEIRPRKVILPYHSEDAKRIRASAIMDYACNRNKLVVLYECPHEGKKERHHPDYEKPLEIKLLCKKCHAAEHVRINRENKAIIFAAIIAKTHFSQKLLPPIQTSTGGTRRTGAGVDSVRKSQDESMGGFLIVTPTVRSRQDEPTAMKSEVVPVQLGFSF